MSAAGVPCSLQDSAQKGLLTSQADPWPFQKLLVAKLVLLVLQMEDHSPRPFIVWRAQEM